MCEILGVNPWHYRERERERERERGRGRGRGERGQSTLDLILTS
jgi:hypothetical protein